MNIPSEEEILRLLKITQQTVWKDKEITMPVINNWLSNFKGEVFNINKETSGKYAGSLLNCRELFQ